jgi:hypothetical protein
MRTSTVVNLALVLFVIGYIYDPTAASRGRLSATYDVHRGQYEILAYGRPPVARPEYADLLWQRYGIKQRVVAMCIVSQPLLSYADAYNAVSVSAAKRRFGDGIFDQTWHDARLEFAKKHPQFAHTADAK